MTSSNVNIFRVTGHFTGNLPVPGEFPNKGQWRGALMFTLICARINGWVNNGEAGELRRHRTHYDVIVLWRCVTTGSGCSLLPKERRPISWLNKDPVHFCIYVSPGLGEVRLVPLLYIRKSDKGKIKLVPQDTISLFIDTSSLFI